MSTEQRPTEQRSTERRHHPRFKLNLPVEVHPDSSDTPIHCTTSDVSLGGCYIESMYPFPVGTHLELKLQIHFQANDPLDDDTLLIFARVVTCDPQFGNGIAFERILPEDRTELAQFLDSVAKQDPAAQSKKAE